MVVQLSAAVVFALYMACIPIKFAVALNSNTEHILGTGIAAFSSASAKRRAMDHLSGLKPPRKKKNIKFDLSKLPAVKSLYRAVKYAIKHLHLEYIEGSIGLGNAAATAIVCGCAASFVNAVGAVSDSNICIRIAPDFNSNKMAIIGSGIISITAGHIICASIIGAFDYGNGRVKKWIDILLKT